MKSKTKYDITKAQLNKIFKAAGLGEVTHSKFVPDGWFNSVLFVTASGVDYVIKIAPHPNVKVLGHERDLMQQELKFNQLLMEKTSIHTPKIFIQDLTRKIIPCDYFIMEKLCNTKLSKQEINEKIEDLLVQFRKLKNEGFGYEQLGLEDNWHKALRKMTQALIDDCRAFGKRCRIGEKLLREIDKHQAILVPVGSCLVNFDLHSGNLFYDNGRLTIIDLERCFWGDWVGDYVNRTGQLPKSATQDERIRLYLLMGYLAVVMYTEKYSRYTPLNKIWWLDVGGTLLYGRRAFWNLRKY